MRLGRAIAFTAERILEPIESMHRAIARPWFSGLGPAGRGSRSVNDAMTSAVYGSVRMGLAALGAAFDGPGESGAGEGRATGAFINALWGDSLDDGHPHHATQMAIHDRAGNKLDASRITADDRAMTGRLVVLVHGLGQTEQCWARRDADGSSALTLLELLDDHDPLTALAIRYNSGLAVSTNGDLLAELLEEVVACWPVPVESIAFVGFSMGGTVVHAARASGRAVGHDWCDHVTDIISIATPHRGAPLEKMAASVAWGLAVAPQTRPLADFMNSRSQGIKDLRWGMDIGDRGDRGDGSAGETEGPEADRRHHFVAGVVTAEPRHLVGQLIGDVMVRPASALGHPTAEPASEVTVGRVHHGSLLASPAVVGTVMAWLDPTGLA